MSTTTRIRGGLATAAVLAMALLMMTAPAAAAAPGLDFSDDTTPNPRLATPTVTIAEHDLGEINDPLAFYDDAGEVRQLPGAEYNDSQTAPYGQRFDKVSDLWTAFPRVDGETSNGATWTEASQWSTSGTGSLTDADANGVKRVTFAAGAAGDSASLAGNVSLDDPNKRVLQAIVNVNALPSGTTVELRLADGDGDYRVATIDTADTPGTDETSIANATGNGYVIQEKVGDLPLAGSGDGTLDAIQSVELHSVGSTADVTIAGLDVDRKSTSDLATIARDTDGDGDDETTQFEDYWEGGVAPVTEYQFGDAMSDATIADWQVTDVHFPLSEVTDESEYSVEFRDSESSYAMELALTADLEAPGFIDVSYGQLNLELEQGSIAERYGVLETATADDDTPIGNSSDSDYTSRLGTVASTGDTLTLKSGVAVDQQQRINLVLYLKDDEVDALQMSISGGPVGSGGGFFSMLWGQLVGIDAAIAGAIGTGRVFRGG